MSKKISRAEFLNMIINWNKEISFSGVTFFNILYQVDESQSKTVKGKKLLQKRVETVITVGSQYEAKCQRLLEKQGLNVDFKSQEIPGRNYKWGKKVPLVVKNDDESKKYLVIIVEGHASPQRQFIHEGKEITLEEAEKLDLFTPAHYVKDEPTPARGMIEAENIFYFRTLSIENVITCKINGTEYVIED